MDYGGGNWRPIDGRPGLRMAVWLQVKVRVPGLGLQTRLYACSVFDIRRSGNSNMRLVELRKCYTHGRTGPPGNLALARWAG